MWHRIKKSQSQMHYQMSMRVRPPRAERPQQAIRFSAMRTSSVGQYPRVQTMMIMRSEGTLIARTIGHLMVRQLPARKTMVGAVRRPMEVSTNPVRLAPSPSVNSSGLRRIASSKIAKKSAKRIVNSARQLHHLSCTISMEKTALLRKTVISRAMRLREAVKICLGSLATSEMPCL